MSQWGNLSNVQLKGTVTTTNTTDLVNGYNGTEFTSNINAGDKINQSYTQLLATSIKFRT